MSSVVDICSYFLHFVLFFQMKRKGVILRSTLGGIKVQFHMYGIPMSTVVDCY